MLSEVAEVDTIKKPSPSRNKILTSKKKQVTMMFKMMRDDDGMKGLMAYDDDEDG